MIHRAFTASPVEADHLFVNSAGTERMRIDSGGIDVTGGIEVINSTAYRGIHLRGNGAPNVTFGRNNVTTAEWKAGISGNLGTSFTISEGTAAASERLVIATGGNVSIPSGNLDVTGTVEFDGLSGTGAVTVTDILDEDDMSSNSATALATQQSIKAYIDNNAGGGSGDITAVVAGTGLSGGATSGSATLNIDAAVVPATATELSSSVDLNDLDGESDAGFYYQTSNTDTTGNNYPDNRAGSLIVQKSAAGVTQLYSTFHPSTPELYFRTYYGSGGNTWNSWRKVWTDANDGSGSGLDADTLDGVQGASYLRSDANDTFTGTLTMAGTLAMGGNPIDNVLDIYLKDKIFHHGDTNTYLHFETDKETFFTGGSRRLMIENSGVTIGSSSTSLGTSSGDITSGLTLHYTSSNNDYLLTEHKRISAGTSWETAQHRIQRKVDSTLMGYISFGKNGDTDPLFTVGEGASTDYLTVTGGGDVDLSADLTVGADLYFTDTNTKIAQNSADSIRVTTPSGIVDIGPQNTGNCHITTDRSQFYINKKLQVDEGIISSYDEDLQLRRTVGDTTNQLTIASGLATFGTQVSMPTLRVTGTGDASNTSTGHGLQIGSTSGANLIIDNNEIIARDNGADSTLNVQLEGGTTTFGGELVVPSKIKHSGDTNTYIEFHNNDQFRVVTGGVERFEVTGSATTVVGNLLVADQVRIGDDCWIEDFNVANSIRIKGNQSNASGFIAFGQQTTLLGCAGNSTLTYGGNTVWHGGNDGSGSGLDADTVDGKHLSALMITDATGNSNLNTAQQSGVYRYNTGFTNGPSGAGGYGTLLVANNASDTGFQMYVDFAGNANAYIRGGNSSTFGGSGSNTSWAKLWSDQNDGSGSGLDADTLDGVQGADYLRAKTRTTWNTSPAVIGNVVGQLAWKNYGNNHTIFDASAGTTPSGTSCNASDPSVAWAGTYPTLMGWNGTNTYGVRVDRAKQADNLDGLDSTQFLRSDTSDTFTGTLTMAGTLAMGGQIIDNVNHIYLGDRIYHHGDTDNYKQFATDTQNFVTGGSTRLRLNNTGAIIYQDLYTPNKIIHSGDTDTYTQFHAADQFRVVTGGTERLEVNNSQVTVQGQLGVNGVANVNGNVDLRADGNTTTARYVHIPRGGGVTFYGDAGASHSITSRNNAGTVADDLNISSYGAVYIMLDKNNNNGSGADFKIYRNGTSTVALTVSGENGNLTAEGDVTAFSDERLKENITVIPNAIEKVSQIRGVTYTRNDQKDKEKVYAGVIAQEVEKVLPEVVNTTEDDTKTVAYGNMVGLLIEAVKEQQEQINELKKQIEEMK